MIKNPIPKTETILERIIAYKIKEIAERKKFFPLTLIQKELKKKSFAKQKKTSFREALLFPKYGDIAIIAEIKKASPSVGIIKKNVSPQKQALDYQAGGADAISVLADRNFFQGSLFDLKEASAAVHIPILCKDFIIDPYQIYEARLMGSAAVLLIADILSVTEIKQYLETANSLALDCLVEIHDEKELQKVLKTSAEIIGVNARNLKTFTIDLSAIIKLAGKIPAKKIAVAESGVSSRLEIEKLKKAGYQAVLVGTALMRSKNPELKIRELKGLG